MREHIWAKRIWTSEGISPECLLQKQPLQIGLAETKTTVFEEGTYVILDFGVELCGGVRILTYKAKNIPVHIRFGESMSECCHDLGGDANATNDHSLRDFSVELQNYSDMTFGQTGFRFLRLDAADGADLFIKSIAAAVDTDTREELGSFECDDPLVNEI